MSEPLRRRGEAPPTRIAHLGLGAFHRAHQAPWTAEVSDWGIAAFTGRRPDLARALTAQGGVYCLLVRSGDGDRVEVIGSISEAVAAEEVGKWVAVVADDATAVLTLTVTEAAYCRDQSGNLDWSRPDVAADLEALRGGPRSGAALLTVPGRLVAGLDARRRAGGGGLAVVPCDNLDNNGAATRRVVADLAGALDADLAGWIAAEVSFVSTVVDRITPATTDEVRATVARLSGFDDLAPVVTEPWREWILAGAFPAGRPPWEDAGARVVEDVGAWAQRKLRLLNGGHSLLAYFGSAQGHFTVADAAADDVCLRWLQAWWDEAAVTLDRAVLPAAPYCDALLARFANRRIAHQLAQIGLDGTEKLAVRVVPVLLERRRRGLESPAAALILGSWLHWLRSPSGTDDPSAPLAQGPLRQAARAVVGRLDASLGDDRDLVEAVAAAAGGLPEGR
ncbi:mannitol dehydrogenase family protein [Acidiferrimicrobium sp. IK]|uniref:mannitol dehydrogenase family protein n=1 Tax=Acidiferrimicrobium sp. IK TaxID=2871700 RepID=UPI0021CB082C|nr:mannitol dehydrogenase family protein [Acidiferrimicrobium sp. IK]MCU4184343.1 mannitol dehydrogenase family protein [Acidiferrimicrobium sp. IK]